MKLKGKRVLLTGASAGIGEALAYEMARRGAHLTLVARRQEALEAVRQACERPDDHRCAVIDLTDYRAAARKVAELSRQVGGFDVVVHNAGISQRSFAVETAIDVDERLMAVDYFAPVAITKALLPEMIQRGHGQIVTVSSLAGKMATPYRSGYSAAKHAIIGFMDALRAETWRQGITVTVLLPGFIATGLSLRALTGDGSPLNQLDDAQKNGMEPARCARLMVDAIEADRDEAAMGGREKYGLYLKRFFPRLFNRVIRKAKVR
jgi:short-subunit dehydrogenase